MEITKPFNLRIPDMLLIYQNQIKRNKTEIQNGLDFLNAMLNNLRTLTNYKTPEMSTKTQLCIYRLEKNQFVYFQVIDLVNLTTQKN